MLALHIFLTEQSDQDVPLRKMHINGNLTKYMSLERLYNSRLIVSRRHIIFVEENRSGPDLETPLYAPVYVDITDQEII